MLLKTMSPALLAFDEITAPADVEAVSLCAHCGTAVVASAHAADVDDLRRRPLYHALLELGVPRHLDGFKYIMESVRLVLCDDHYERNFSKRLYPAVARRYNTTASCVERSIRHAVETAWAHISLSVLQREFGNTIDGDRGKPTNSEFIARMVDKLRHGGEYIPGGD